MDDKISGFFDEVDEPQKDTPMAEGVYPTPQDIKKQMQEIESIDKTLREIENNQGRLERFPDPIFPQQTETVLPKNCMKVTSVEPAVGIGGVFQLNFKADVTNAGYMQILKNKGYSIIERLEQSQKDEHVIQGFVQAKGSFDQIAVETASGISLVDFNMTQLRTLVDEFLYEHTGKGTLDTLSDIPKEMAQRFDASVEITYTSLRQDMFFASEVEVRDPQVFQNLVERSGVELHEGQTPLLAVQGSYIGDNHDVVLGYASSLFVLKADEQGRILPEKHFIELMESEKDSLHAKAEEAVKGEFEKSERHSPAAEAQKDDKTETPKKQKKNDLER